MTWRALANHVLSSLFEPPCAACSAVLARPLDGAVCDACWEGIRVAPPLGGWGSSLKTIDRMAAVGAYEGRLRDVVHALKYGGRLTVAPRLGALMREAGAEVLAGADAAVPVPLHWRRERSRGFNQAEVLARPLGLPVRRLLRRVEFTVPQVELPAEERHRNVRHAFALPSPGSRFPSPKGLVLVLVDDVSTTGATLEACARVLKAAGAREVRALTAARVATVRR